MLRPGMQRVTATHQPLKVNLVGQQPTRFRENCTLLGVGVGGHPTKSSAPTAATPANFSLQLPAPHPRATSKLEKVPRLKDPVPPEPWERTDLEQEFARCDGRRASPGRWPLAMPC